MLGFAIITNIMQRNETFNDSVTVAVFVKAIAIIDNDYAIARLEGNINDQTKPVKSSDPNFGRYRTTN